MQCRKGVFLDLLAEDLARHGAAVAGPYLCPHRFSRKCRCAKPEIHLYEQAASEHHISLGDSYSIGDTSGDVEAAVRFGGVGCLVRTGYAAGGKESSRAERLAHFSGRTLGEVADWILRRTEAERTAASPPEPDERKS